MARRFVFCAVGWLICTFAYAQTSSYPYLQSFEASLSVGEEVEFLPFWWGNDVRSTNSRIHSWDTHAQAGSQSLGVVATSSFEGEVTLRANLSSLVHPQLVFHAASDKNGSTSTRPALVTLSWSVDLGATFPASVAVGDTGSFPNADFSGFQRFSVSLPDSLTEYGEVHIRWTVARGEGSGSAARWLLDSVALLEGGPKLVSVLPKTDTTLLAVWDDALDSTSAVQANYYSLAVSEIWDAHWEAGRPNEVLLTTSRLVDGTQYLRVNSIQSSAGALRTEPDSASFSYLLLAWDSVGVVADTVLFAKANQTIENPSGVVSLLSRDLSDWSWGADSTELWLYWAEPLASGDSVGLVSGGISNAVGNSTLEDTLWRVYIPQLRLLDWEVMDTQRVRLRYNLPLDSAQFGVWSFLRSSDSTQMLAVAWEASSPEQVVLTWPEPLAAGACGLFIAPILPLDTAALASVWQEVGFSYLPMGLLDAGVWEDAGLWLRFNQAVELPAAQQIWADGELGFPSIIELRDDTLLLSWDSTLVHHEYAIHLDSLSNELGNARLDTVVYLFYEGTIPPDALVINEIFADPNPKGLLPDSVVWPTESSGEFVELYNRSSRTYSLAGTALSGKYLDTVSILPGGYLVITSSRVGYEETGSLMELADWNSLTNSGESVWLAGPDGVLLDSLVYSDTWYREGDKNGGWSLERINPIQDCSDADNWRASVDATGATPNGQNSVYSIAPDEIYPKLQMSEADLPTMLVLTFSEMMMVDAVYSAWESSPFLNFEGKWSEDQRELWLSFPDSMLPNTTYTLRIDSVLDCAGNPVEDTTIGLVWDTLPPVLEEGYVRDWDEIWLDWNEALGEKVDIHVWVDTLEIALETEVGLADGDILRLKLSKAISLGDTVWVRWDTIRDQSGNVPPSDSMYWVMRNAVDTVYGLTDRVTLVVFSEVLDSSVFAGENFYIESLDMYAEAVVPAGNSGSAYQLIWPQALQADRVYELVMHELFDTAGVRLMTPAMAWVWDQEPPQIDSVWAVHAYATDVLFHEAVDSARAMVAEHYALNDEISPDSVTWLSARQVRLHWPSALEQETVYRMYVRSLVDLWGNALSRARRYDFVWDTLSPRLLDVYPLSDTLLRFQWSEEVSWSDSVGWWVNGQSLDSVWSNTQEPTWVYASRSAGWADTSVLHLTTEVVDAVGHALVLDTLLDISMPRILRAQFLDPQHLLLQGYPAVASFSLQWKRGEAMGIDSAGVGAWTANWESSFVVGEQDTLQITFSDGKEQKWPLVYPPSVRKVEHPQPNILQLSFTHDLAGYCSSAVPRVLPDSISPLVVVTEENQQQWIFQDTIRPNTAYTLQVPSYYDGAESRIPASRVSYYEDQTHPEIIRVSVVGRRSLSVLYQEPVLGAGTAYSLGDGRKPSDWSGDGDTLWILEFEEAFEPNDTLALSIEGLVDTAGNFITPMEVSLVVPQWPTPIPGNLHITEVMADPSPPLGLPEEEYVELWNASEDSLWVEDWSFTDGRDTAMLPAQWWPANSFLLLTRLAARGLFPDSIRQWPLSRFPSLNNAGETLTLLDERGSVLTSLTYQDAWHTSPRAEEGGVALERASGDSPCFSETAWASSLYAAGGTPGFANSLADWSPDTTAPAVASAGLLATHTLCFTFTEPIDTLTPPTIALSESRVGYGVQYPQGGQQLIMQFSPPLDSGARLQVQLEGVADCPGNRMADTTVSLVLGRSPRYGELLLSEIRPHPTDEVALPLSEYLELYNASSHFLELGGVVLSDATGSTTLPPFVLYPGSYVTLCPTSQVGAFAPFGLALGVPGWRTLNKSGERITLRTKEQSPLASVVYPDDWFGAYPEGVSWELANLSEACRGPSVWRPSTGLGGGTPGQRNASVLETPDLTPPDLVAATLQDSTHLRLVFDEPLQYPLPSGTLITVTPSLGDLRRELAWPSAEALVVSFSEVPKPSTAYLVEVRQVTDCVGNVDFNPHSAVFAKPDLAVEHDIVLNELLFDPPFGGVDFLEIYNRSEKYVDLTHWTVGADTSTDVGESLDNRLTGWLLPPYAYRVFTSDAALLRAYFPSVPVETIWEVDGLPNWVNGEGEVALWTSDGRRIDALVYDEDWHSPLLSDTKGVSLERLNVDSPTQSLQNWHSAAKASGYGTPGSPNSQQVSDSASVEILLAAEPIAFDPRGDQGVAFTTIRYELPGPGYWGTVEVYDVNGRVVRTLLAHELVGLSGWLRWDGLLASGQLAPMGPYWVRGEFYHPDGQKLHRQIRIVVATSF